MSGWLEVTLIGMVFENREEEGVVSDDENDDRFNFYTTTVDMDKDMYQDILSIATDTSGEIADYPGAALIFVAQPISPSMTAASMKTGGNALGLPQNTNMMCPSPLPLLPYPNTNTSTDVNFAVAWENSTHDKPVIETCKRGIQRIARAAGAKGLARDFLFMNDAGDDQDVLGSYGSANRASLRKVGREVDPHSVFQILAKGGFKL